MSDEQKASRPQIKNDLNEIIKDVLNFGPERPEIESNVSSRLKELVKKLQDLNRRIDNLASRM